MTKDCFKGFVGIRGVCEDDARVYIDSLPAISLKKSALIAEEGSGLDLIKDISQNSVDGVIMDIKSALNDCGYIFHGNKGEVNHKSAGTDVLSGDEDKFYSAVIESSLDKNCYLDVSFEIYLTCDADKTIYITRGLETEERQLKLTQGLNRINFKSYDRTNRVFFNPLGVLIGKNYSEGCGCKERCEVCCNKCASISFEEGINVGDSCEWNKCPDFGANVYVQCKYDFELLICDNIDLIDKAVLYKAGINWIHSAIHTDRVNEFTNGAIDKLVYYLLKLEGGESADTANRFKGDYPKEIEIIAKSLIGRIPTDVFDCEITEIVGGLK